MEIRQLQYFTAIARTGGFRHAADELHVSQATLSEQIKFLEQELGVRLFERGTRTVALTEAGASLLRRAEHMLAEVRATREEMREYTRLERGQLSVGAVTGTGPTFLPSFLAGFLHRHPQIDVRVVERTTRLLLKLLESGDLNVACLLVPTEDSPVSADLPAGIAIQRVFSRDLVAVVAPGHRLALKAEVSIVELAEERLILTSEEETPRALVDDAFAAHHCRPLVHFETNDPTTLILLAAEGVGVGITGGRVVAEHAGQVVSVPIAGAPLTYSMALAWSERGAHTRALTAFLEYAGAWLSEWGVRTAETTAPRSAAAIG